MTHTKGLAKRIFIGLLALFLTLSYPSAISFAEGDNPAPAPAQTQTGPPTTPGSTKPNGPDANTYHFNEASGKWENDHYIWDPNTRQTRPKATPNYSYNPNTNMWDTTEWRYNAATGKYEPNAVSVAQAPAGSATTGSPTSPTSTATTESSTGTTTTATPTPSPTVDNTVDTNSTFNGFYNAGISNNLTSTALSGSAGVIGNTNGGDAITGNANAAASVFNLLQSSASLADAGKLNTFSQNIDGNVVGDLIIDPGLIAAMQPASNTNTLNSNVKINADTDSSISNNLTLNAGSGNAAVSENTKAGDATTGNANAVANLVNLMNSSIAGGQSFLGTLNINGDFNGDILLPSGMLNALLANNAPTTTVKLTKSAEYTVRAALTDNHTINNNVTTAAASGNAKVNNNTKAGDAVTGDATTNITVLNLTGREIVGSNSLLVFVNVLGKWVGAIVDAPSGATAAALGGNISQNRTTNSNTEINAASNSKINNNLLLNARSGDASVTNNTTGGNARTGNATASANIANITNSNFSLSDWFGILFINVFGTWQGSFGVNTEAGNPAAPAIPSTTAAVAAQPETAASRMRVFRFAPASSSSTDHPSRTDDAAVYEAQEVKNLDAEGQVLAASTPHNRPATIVPKKTEKTDLTFPIAALSVGTALAAVERTLAFRDRRRMHI